MPPDLDSSLMSHRFDGTIPGSWAKRYCMSVMVWFRGCKSPYRTPTETQEVLVLAC